MRFDTDGEEEFEFKPLTQGLGFHPVERQSESASSKKKNLSLNRTESAAKPMSSGPLSLNSRTEASAASTKKTSGASHPASLRSAFLQSPLPRPTTPTSPTPSNSGKAVENILKSLNENNKNLNFTDKGKPVSPYLQVSPSLGASFLDLLLVASLGLIYLMSLIFTLKIDLLKTLTNGGPSIWFATGAVFLGVGFVYYTVQRIFLGFTIGDWAYEQRLGIPDEMQNPSYYFKVFWRQTLIMATGIIVLPILSWIVRRDLAGVSGLCLYRKR